MYRCTCVDNVEQKKEARKYFHSNGHVASDM